MKRKSLLFIVLALVLSACGESSAGIAETTAPPTATRALPPPSLTEVRPSPTAGSPSEPTPSLTAEIAPEPTPSFQLATYTDDNAGFSLDYPAEWMVDDSLGGGSRGYVVQLTSWTHAPGNFDYIPPGGSVLAIMVLNWDPKNDLDAYVDHFKQGWESSGISILSEQEWMLAGGHRAVFFLNQGMEGEVAFFMLSTLGERYLQLSGSGNVDLLFEISRTLRFNE